MFIGVIFLILGGSVYFYTRHNYTRHNYTRHDGTSRERKNNNDSVNNTIIFREQKRGTGDDVFFDIYKAPLRDDRCMTGGGGDIRGAVPVNVSTQSCADAPYRQLGILTRYGGKDETILPLMGRPLFSKRDKWNFYTLNDKNNMIKLPVKVKGKSGTSEIGCDNVYTGDIVFVEGYNDAFKVTTYDNDVIRYLPSL